MVSMMFSDGYFEGACINKSGRIIPTKTPKIAGVKKTVK